MVITMKALVTGGAGFVGSHLIQALLDKNFEVSCLDDFSTGKLENLETFRNQISILTGDIRNPDIINSALKDIDYVFHLAAQISVTHSVRDPLHDASINIDGFITLLNGIRNSSVKRTIYVSTGGAIYGEPDQVPAVEDTPEKPISPYGLSKLVGEKYLEWYHQVYSLSYSIIRPANIYGPRQDPLGEAGVISIFLGNIKAEKPIILYGDGSTTRDYIYVKDVANLCMKILEKPLNEAVNVGTGKETSLQSLIKTIHDVTNLEITKKNKNLREGEVKKISLDISRISEITTWSPQTELSQGISEVWDWINS